MYDVSGDARSETTVTLAAETGDTSEAGGTTAAGTAGISATGTAGISATGTAGISAAGTADNSAAETAGTSVAETLDVSENEDNQDDPQLQEVEDGGRARAQALLAHNIDLTNRYWCDTS